MRHSLHERHTRLSHRSHLRCVLLRVVHGFPLSHLTRRGRTGATTDTRCTDAVVKRCSCQIDSNMPAQVTADAAAGTGAAALATADVAGRKTAAGRKAACRRMSMSLMMFFFINAKRVRSLDVAEG